MQIETLFRIMIFSWLVASNPVMAITAIGFGDSITAGLVLLGDRWLACGKQIRIFATDEDETAKDDGFNKATTPCPEQRTCPTQSDCDDSKRVKLGNVRQGGYIRKLDLLLNEKIGPSAVYNWGSLGERTSKKTTSLISELPLGPPIGPPISKVDNIIDENGNPLPVVPEVEIFTGQAFRAKGVPESSWGVPGSCQRVEDMVMVDIEELVDDRVIRREELKNNKGSYIALGIYRIMKAVTAPKPNYILIMEGTNDISNIEEDSSIDSEEEVTINNLEVMARTAIACGVIPVLATITPNLKATANNKNAKIIEKYNPKIRKLADEMGIALADQFAALACTPEQLEKLEQGLLTVDACIKKDSGWKQRSKEKFFQDDGLHLKDEGNRLVAETYFKAMFPDKDPRHTEIKDNASERNLLGAGGILDKLYGIGNLERIDDDGDQFWENLGTATATAKASYRTLPVQLNYIEDSDKELKPLFWASGNQGPATGFGELPPKDELPTFKWAITADNAADPPFFSSQPSDGRDDADHMVAWEITDGADEGNKVGNYVIAWEDRPIPGADRDFQDLVVEVSNVQPIKVPDRIEVVNDLFPPIGSDDVERDPFDSTYFPAAPGGVFTFRAKFLNDTTSTVKEPRIKILELSNPVDGTRDLVLLDASNKSLGGVGAIVNPGVDVDKFKLGPGESMTVEFKVGFVKGPHPFKLIVDVLGVRSPSSL